MRSEKLSYGSLERFIGSEIGLSGWTQITQEQAILFASITHDPDPMHVDPPWTKENSPYGQTVAAGMHMIALLPFLTRGSALILEGVELAMNYGFNRIRFISPLPIGSRFRNRMTLMNVDRREDGNTAITTLNQFESPDGVAFLAAEWLNLLWPIATRRNVHHAS